MLSVLWCNNPIFVFFLLTWRIAVTAVLALLTCFIPPMSSSKLLVGMVQLLLISGHLIYFDSILAGSETTPLIGI